MKKSDNRNMWFFILTFVFSLCLLTEANSAVKDRKMTLFDKAFTDSSLRTEMPEEWISQRIRYEKETEGSDITIVLDQDIYHTLLPIIRKFGKERNLKIAAKEGTCGIAAGMLGKKKVDMGGFCCPPGKEDRLPGIEFHTIGIVAKALLVHQDNPVNNVTIEQARDIFRGRLVRWSEMKMDTGKAGPDWTIMAIGRFHCKARPGHWYLLLPDEKMFGPLLKEVASIPDMISQVSANREAIGWEVLSMVEHYKELSKVKSLKINGYAPTDKNALASKKYPLYRTYNVTTWTGKKVENVHAKELVKYLMKEAEKIESRYGFVPSSMLRKAGWKFKDDELIGGPGDR